MVLKNAMPERDFFPYVWCPPTYTRTMTYSDLFFLGLKPGYDHLKFFQRTHLWAPSGYMYTFGVLLIGNKG